MKGKTEFTIEAFLRSKGIYKERKRTWSWKMEKGNSKTSETGMDEGGEGGRGQNLEESKEEGKEEKYYSVVRVINVVLFCF